MANGKKHAKATRQTMWILFIVSSGIILYYQQMYLIGLYVGAILGHLITPDIDHHWVTYEEQRIFRINRLLGWLWYCYWFPYQWAFRHRGLSHVLLIGTLSRFSYLLWYPVIAYPEHYPFYVFVFITWFIQDYTHLILDI